MASRKHETEPAPNRVANPPEAHPRRIQSADAQKNSGLLKFLIFFSLNFAIFSEQRNVGRYLDRTSTIQIGIRFVCAENAQKVAVERGRFRYGSFGYRNPLTFFRSQNSVHIVAKGCAWPRTRTGRWRTVGRSVSRPILQYT